MPMTRCQCTGECGGHQPTECFTDVMTGAIRPRGSCIKFDNLLPVFCGDPAHLVRLCLNCYLQACDRYPETANKSTKKDDVPWQ